jgi:hypothetical protein
MRKAMIYIFSVALCLSVSASFGQTKSITRQPIKVDSNFFSNLKTAPHFMSQNRLAPATNAAIKNQDPRIISVPTFTRSFTFGGQTFPYTMVGQDPSLKRATTVPVTYVPMSLIFDEFVDANGNSISIDAEVITDEIKNSPVFARSPFSTGFTQLIDAEMRAQFFSASNNDRGDGFHLFLGVPKTLTPVTIEVPVGSGLLFQLPDGNLFAFIDIAYINAQLNTLVQTEGISVDSIPIFLTRNAVYGQFFQGNPVSCCVGGFHTAFETKHVGNKSFVQVIAFATSLDQDIAQGLFGAPLFADVFALSHEVAELANNPFINNATPNYQLPGLPDGACQANLEVGDGIINLLNSSTTITLNGFDYHPQNVATLQWFEGITPSDAIDGAYSYPDITALTAPFRPCPF